MNAHVEIQDDLTANQPLNPKPTRAQKRILVVDDEPSVTRNLKLLLEASGHYTVRGENDSARAVESARSFRPDLILLDVLMPEPDGWEVAARIRLDPELSKTPIVYLTALASNKHTHGHAVATGSIVFMAKPVEIGELIRCIEEHSAGGK